VTKCKLAQGGLTVWARRTRLLLDGTVRNPNTNPIPHSRRQA